MCGSHVYHNRSVRQSRLPLAPLYCANRYPICGHYFWDDHAGATLLCQALGFTTGYMKIYRNAFPHNDAMPVGRCRPGELLTHCTRGGNAWGNLHYQGGWCKRGKRIGVAVMCRGGQPTAKDSTDDGHYYLSEPATPCPSAAQVGSRVHRADRAAY